jgi:hypothetical protein
MKRTLKQKEDEANRALQKQARQDFSRVYLVCLDCSLEHDRKCGAQCFECGGELLPHIR